MSRGKIETVREGLAMFNESGLANLDEFWDPEIVWETDPLVPEPGVYTGFEAVRTYLEGFIRAFGAWHVEIHDLIDLGGDEVLALLTVGGRPLGQTEQETQFLNWAQIASVRNGKITRIRSFLDKARAFEAAGLRE